MRVYVNNYSVVCSLGHEKAVVQDGLFSRDLNKVDQFNLVDNIVAPVMTVAGDLPTIISEFEKYQSKNNQLLLQALLGIESGVSDFFKKYGPERIGIIIGTSTSGIAEGVEAMRDANNGSLPKNYLYERQELGSPSLFLKEYLKLTSIAYTVSTACSSGARAFLDGKRLLENDICDVVIVGGADSLNELTLNGFHALEAVSTKRTNPFSKNRRGINIGEGSALFILSKDEGPFELLAVGESTDAYHLSSPDPNGDGAIRAMEMALENSKLDFCDIDYINLHGTGTILNDSMEAKAVARLFKNDVFVSSTKPFTGHTLGAAGSIEAAFSLMAMENKNGYLPIHHWDGEGDDRLPELNFVTGLTKVHPKICMSNSYAFGGNNVSIIMGKVNDR